ncbi:hypothetical protein [Streptomyces sp. NPDC005533]
MILPDGWGRTADVVLTARGPATCEGAARFLAARRAVTPTASRADGSS